MPAQDRRAALRNLVLAWAPFDASEYRVGLRGEMALAWAWDSRQVADLLRAAGADDHVEVLPEGLLRPPMAADGMRLMNCLEGVEAQAWVAGFPVLSRWWPERPDEAEWASFARGASPTANVPALPTTIDPVAWQRRPWFDCQGLDALASPLSRIEVLAAAAAVACLVALTAGQASQTLGLVRLIDARKTDIEQIRSAAAPLLTARDSALSASAEADTLAQGLAGVQPIEVLRHLGEVLPPKGVTLKQFELTDRVLRLGLELAPEVQRSEVVKELQAGGWLSGVTELPAAQGHTWVTFEMRLTSLNPPLAAARMASAASVPGSAAAVAATAPATLPPAATLPPPPRSAP